MHVRVVTVTSRPGHPWLREAVASVAQTIPPSCEHVVVQSSGDPLDWNRDLWGACQEADAVAIVDDDDIVLPGAVTLCAQALATHQCGLAFTDEQEIDAQGNPLREGMRRSRRLMDLAMHPRSIHHLAMFRPSFVPPSALGLANECGRGLDWLMRAAAGLRGGAVRVPMIGYQWRRHGGQDSTSGADLYAAAMPALRRLTRSWMAYDAAIPEMQL